MNAIEAGIITTSTKDRLEQLEQEKYKLEIEISTQQLNSNMLLSEEQIIYMLNEFYKKELMFLSTIKLLIASSIKFIFTSTKYVLSTI